MILIQHTTGMEKVIKEREWQQSVKSRVQFALFGHKANKKKSLLTLEQVNQQQQKNNNPHNAEAYIKAVTIQNTRPKKKFYSTKFHNQGDKDS